MSKIICIIRKPYKEYTCDLSILKEVLLEDKSVLSYGLSKLVEKVGKKSILVFDWEEVNNPNTLSKHLKILRIDIEKIYFEDFYEKIYNSDNF